MHVHIDDHGLLVIREGTFCTLFYKSGLAGAYYSRRSYCFLGQCIVYFGRVPSYYFDHQPSEILRTPNGCIQTVDFFCLSTTAASYKASELRTIYCCGHHG